MTLNQVVHFYYIVILFCFTKLKSIFSYAFTLLLKLHCLYIKLIIFSFFFATSFFQLQLGIWIFLLSIWINSIFWKSRCFKTDIVFDRPSWPKLRRWFQELLQTNLPSHQKAELFSLHNSFLTATFDLGSLPVYTWLLLAYTCQT